MIQINLKIGILTYKIILILLHEGVVYEMNRRNSILILFILFGTVQTATALERDRLGLVKEGELSLITGAEYREGDYGTPDSTSLLRIPFSVTYRKTNFSLFASIPLLFASSDGDIIINSKTSMPKMTAPSGSGKNTEAGIGDTLLSASYYLTPDYRQETEYRLTAIYKLATADEDKGLGTGEDDYAFEAGIAKNIDEYILSGTLGYEINGDSPDYTYNDVLYGTAGLTKQLPGYTQIGSYLTVSQALTDTTDAPLELSLFYSQPVAKARNLYLYVSKGFSDGSPDFALGGNIQFDY